jgi:hypothetical protein
MYYLIPIERHQVNTARLFTEVYMIPMLGAHLLSDDKRPVILVDTVSYKQVFQPLFFPRDIIIELAEIPRKLIDDEEWEVLYRFNTEELISRKKAPIPEKEWGKDIDGKEISF